MVKTCSSGAREIFDKRWALAAVFLGTALGFLSVLYVYTGTLLFLDLTLPR
jgi:hypothetical protein